MNALAQTEEYEDDNVSSHIEVIHLSLREHCIRVY
jgi:hypothetical protein